MRHRLIIGASFIGLLAFAAVARADSGATGNVNFSLGQKFLNSDWKSGDTDLRDQFEFGAMFDIRPQPWPINIAIDLLGSRIKDNGITGDTSELSLGVRKYFLEDTTVQPFVGGGIADITGSESHRQQGSNVIIEDDAFGVWLMGGLMFRPTQHLNLGFDVRYSAANITFLDKDVQAGGVHYGLFAGYHF